MALGHLLQIPAVSDYIFQADFDGQIAKIVKKFSLPVQRSDELLDLVNAVLDDVITPSEMPVLIAEAFALDNKTSKTIAADLVGATLLPLTNYLPNLEIDLEAMGGKVVTYSSDRVPKDSPEQPAMIAAAIKDAGIEFTDLLVKRCVYLLSQYSNKQFTDESLKTYFTRSENIGGLGLSEDQAAALLAAVLPHVTQFVGSSIPPAPAVSNSTVSITVAPVLSQELEIVPTHEVAAEVPVAAGKLVDDIPPLPPMPKLKAQPSAPKMQTAVKVSRAPETDVDTNELKAPAKKAAAARKLIADVQDTFATALVLATENAATVLKKNKISEKVFADTAGKAIRGLRDIYQTRDIVERDWELKGQDLATLMAAITAGVEVYQSRPVAQESKVESLKSKVSDEEQLDKRFTRLTDGQATDNIEPARAQLTVGSAVPKTPEGQRKMVDVINTARLAGPIEQLGKMSPTEFRRLSSNASEAAQKIEDLLSVLQTTSYEERVKGVLAWRDSPMNQLYLQIAEEALSQGLALPEISSRRRAAGNDSLSPAEIKALALLNGKIRF